MYKAFEYARAVEDDKYQRLVEGRMKVGDFVLTDDGGYYHYIDTNTVCWSTGFVDYEGNDVFTGDYVSLFHGAYIPIWYGVSESLVFFDEDYGAFFYTPVPNGDCNDPFAGKRRPFTRERAANKFIVGNIFEKLGKEW